MAELSPDSLPFYDAVGSPPAPHSSQVESVYSAAAPAVTDQCRPSESLRSQPHPSPLDILASFDSPPKDEDDEHVDPFMFRLPTRDACHHRSPSLPTPTLARAFLPAGCGRPAFRLHARTRSCGGAWQGTPPPTTPLPPLPFDLPAGQDPLDGLIPEDALDTITPQSHCPAPPEPKSTAFVAYSPTAPPTARVSTFRMLEGSATEANRLSTVCEASEHSQCGDAALGQPSWQRSPSPTSYSHRSRSHTQGSGSSLVSTDASQSQSSYIDFDSPSSVGSCDSAIQMTPAPTPVYSKDEDGPIGDHDNVKKTSVARAVEAAPSHPAGPLQPILRDQIGEHEQFGFASEGREAAIRRRPSKLIKHSRYLSRSVAPLALRPPRTVPLLHRGLSAGSQDAATPTLSTPCSAVPESSQGMDDDADDDIATPSDEIDSLAMPGKNEFRENAHKPERIHSRSLSWTRFKERFR